MNYANLLKSKRVKVKYNYRLCKMLNNNAKPREKGQSLVLFAVTFVAMLAFVGLVIDVGALYVTYTQLKRAVDAAAVAAANNIKFPQASEAERKHKITEAAREMLVLHDVIQVNSLNVYMCTETSIPAEFAAMCPDPGEPPRKLAWVEATQNSPVYFLQLFGVQSIPFTTGSVGEAATVDLVLVIDTSESMASAGPEGYDPPRCTPPACTPNYDANNFDPEPCNTAAGGWGNCYPMRQAKEAAAGLIQNLFDGYDQVAIVTYDYEAHVQFNLDSDMSAANDAIRALVTVHDDPASALLPWLSDSPLGGKRVFNRIFPDDRDGDGEDADPGATCVDEIDFHLCTEIDTDGDGEPDTTDCSSAAGKDMWDDDTGEPCDVDAIFDAFDWNHDGVYGNETETDDTSTFQDTSLLSTCIGCGIRVGTDVLRAGGRPTSLWVMIFLTDGIPNLSDLPADFGGDPNAGIPATYIYGFCGNDPNPDPAISNSFWSDRCIDFNATVGRWGVPGRYCIDTDSAECPELPGGEVVTPTTTSKPYSVEDYAFDMADAAALLESDNEDEPLGEDIIVYSIGLGSSTDLGSNLLRYIANIGEDGSRDHDPCDGVALGQNCGNYFYAPEGAYLDQVFESIAARIFTKISR